MRLGFDAKRLFLNDRGLGNYARNLLYGLVKYHPQHEYFLYTPKQHGKLVDEKFLADSQVQVRLPAGMGRVLSAYWRSGQLGRVAARDGVQVWHGLSQELPADIIRVDVKSVVTVHDLIFLRHPEFYKPLDRWIYLKKVKWAVQHADKVVAISQQTRQDVLETFTLPPDRVQVIYQSCHEVFYEKRSAQECQQVRAKWRLPQQYMLYIGALNENKNVLVILQAMRQLKGKLDLPLVIVGHGEAYKRKLLAYAQKHGLEKQLYFASEIANPAPRELSAFYQMAEVFIFPSFYEGFGIPILEARFSGTPVVASNSSCLHEAGGESSYYFNLADSEELAGQLLKILAARPSTGSGLEKFLIERLAAEWIALYNNL
ncbi:MAG TPA: glycosyltransferase family 1 protein [Flammeovirgaceae bacterium]|nr:glycosyltransferase family 1 protein [Flammeovirgaceae bacterium]